MTTILVTNDDGIDSPALLPLLRALAGEHRRVHALVPKGERSWIGKAITRFEPIAVEARRLEDVLVHTATGTPADCVNLGVHSVFEERPDLVVSGVNVGLNHGLAFMLSSGTIGAATEGFIGGVPAVAFSVGVPQDHPEWSKRAWAGREGPMWVRAARVAADITAGLLGTGLPKHADLLSVNMPADVDDDTPRRVTEIARVGYDALFTRDADGHFVHQYRGPTRGPEDLEGTDLAAIEAGCISITPIALPRAAVLSEEERAALERRA